jgi:ribosome-associated protein
VVVLDLRGLSDVTDFFIVCHGSSDRHVLAVTESIEGRLRRELGIRPAHVEGRNLGDWVLLDFIDFVAHVFVTEKRDFYRLERLWGDAPRFEFAAEDSARPEEAGPGSADG